jgi:hypothetical protein
VHRVRLLARLEVYRGLRHRQPRVAPRRGPAWRDRPGRDPGRLPNVPAMTELAHRWPPLLLPLPSIAKHGCLGQQRGRGSRVNSGCLGERDLSSYCTRSQCGATGRGRNTRTLRL